MADRPSQHWRENVAAEAAEVARGVLGPDDAFAAQLFPVSLLDATDAVLSRFEVEVGRVTEPTDDDVMDMVRRVVLDLNRVNDDHGGAGYETGEREQLCDYIDAVLGEAGIDVPALAERRGINRWELTDDWREW
ncbi:hypothetical protein [Catellatospora vulcania]|uniref:hypothetical protein n=1 Tax=Catellatospora vulcania TaxID=1460450 RepID=UPI0012D4454E|nr:hypothetical protein [Catellatospora vulcania]